MALRFTEAEKGKHHMNEENIRRVKRIKAPSLDTAALIKDNALTLIGRITNPFEQKIWALIQSLPRKWNLQGRAVGSDLGNNCFQFRFEREDDLRRVLDNRPYHFAYWMVILQRWEPVISPTFPSVIPFWIKVKGLPLHYWHEDMLWRVAQELGTMENHELTKTTAKIRVFIDGLKPLVKESIVEFDSGEEVYITLEYEKLEMHCSFCYSLLHAKKNCPERTQEDRPRELSPVPLQTTASRNPEAHDEVNASKYRLHTQKHHSENHHQDLTILTTEEAKGGKNCTTHPFQERVDRHGNPFGERISTKQTRNPPPARSAIPPENPQLAWRPKATQEKTQLYASPPYAKDRENSLKLSQRNKDLFPTKSLSAWKPRRRLDQEATSGYSPVHLEANKADHRGRCTEQNEIMADQVPTLEAVMEDLHDATRLYLSCSDPKEAAARKQRVQQSDENGDMEETAARIITRAKQQLTSVMPRVNDSNPNTPPPLTTNRFDSTLMPENHTSLSPHGEKETGNEEELVDYGVELPPPKDVSRRKNEKQSTAKLKSIVVSPDQVRNDSQKSPQTQQLNLGTPGDGETLQEFQDKVRRNHRTTPRKKSPRGSLNILTGISLKKRKLSQLQNSPSAGRASGGSSVKITKKAVPSTMGAESSLGRNNPPINLIPAVSKRKPDFRVPRTQVP